jgi:hypothetical protein
MKQLIPLIGLIVAACVILYLSNTGILERFEDSPLTPLIDKNQASYNKIANIINPMNPQVKLSDITSQNFIQSTISPNYNISEDSGTTAPLEIPNKQSNDVTIAQTICEKINTADCNAFDNPEFLANCGIALDIGTASTGKPHTGGLYFTSNSRQSQKLNKNIINGKDYNTYTPTIGTSKVFVTDKDMCLRKQVDLKCKQSKVIGEGNSSATCSLCFTDGSYHATAPNSNPGRIQVFILSNMDSGPNTILTITIGSNTQKLVSNGSQNNINTFESSPFQTKEGDKITITASQSNKTDIYVAGWIQGPKPSYAPYRTDLMAIINQDYNQPPFVEGTALSYFKFNQQPGNTGLQLSGIIPFSFTMPPNPDADNCANGPFVTQAASMVALNADGDCYSSENGPGNYTIGCLQKVFRGMGGTIKGTGYPSESNKRNLLFDTNGNPRTLGQITDYLGGLAVQAATGLNNGVSMAIPDWNNVSLFMTGKAITNACETSGKGYVTTDCLNFLYSDPGTYGNSVGQNQSLNSQDFQTSLICRPEGALSPSNPEGLMRAKAVAAKGGKEAVKQLYRNAYITANNTSLSNADRKQGLKDCYGVKVLNPKAEVFAVSTGSGGYNVAYNDAQALCTKVGAVMATTAQLNEAQAAGSQVCGCGWTADDQIAKYPMVQSGVPGCGSPGSGGLVKYVKLAGGSSYINLAQIVIKDKNGYNVAPNGTTSSSGAGYDTSERKAIDGTERARPHPSMYHSTGQNAFFQVALSKPTQISSVTVYNRSDCCQDRMVGYKVYLYDSNNNLLFTSSPLTANNVQTVSINLPTSSSLVTCGDMKTRTGGKATVFCYGPKPDKDSVPANIKVGDWSQTLQTISAGWSNLGNVITKWSQFS